LLPFLVDVDLKFPQSPSAQSTQLVWWVLTGYASSLANFGEDGSPPKEIDQKYLAHTRMAQTAALEIYNAFQAPGPG
jgi:hypothetical protein